MCRLVVEEREMKDTRYDIPNDNTMLRTDESKRGRDICTRTLYADAGFWLEYTLTCRENCDAELEVPCLYDITLTKKDAGYGSLERVHLSAVSSVYERAQRLFECMYKNSVTPMCVYEFLDEYYSLI